MGLKSNLRIKLYADDNCVAEINNAPLMLWQQLLSHSEGALHGDVTSPAPAPVFSKAATPQPTSISHTEVFPETVIERPLSEGTSGIAKLAEDIEVSEDAIISAFDPIDTSPYIALEHKYWEAFRNNVSTKGRGAVSPAAIVATLLALWKFHGKKDFVLNVALINKILDKLSSPTNNTARALNRCDWLKVRQDDEIVIIPDNAKKARAVAKAFCTKQAVQNVSNA